MLMNEVISITPRPSDLDHLRWILHGNTDLIFDNMRILDLGCGSGFLCEYFKKTQITVGIDVVTPPEIFRKEKKWVFDSIDLNKQNWSNIIFDKYNCKFDVLFTFDIIEHLTSPWDFLINCNNILSNNGILYMSTPNTNSWERYFKGKNWSGAIDKQHKHLFCPYSLRFLIERIPLRIEDISCGLRSLEFLKYLNPSVGGQIFCKVRKINPGLL